MAAVEYSHVYYASAHSPIRKGHKEWNKKKKTRKKKTHAVVESPELFDFESVPHTNGHGATAD